MTRKFPHHFDPEDCAQIIRRADSVVVLTGAGISTGAGIPDFRGPQGLYVTRRYDPDTVFDINHFRRDPLPFYEFSRDFAEMLKTIQPTFTHRFLAALEERGLLRGVITQNIDALHHHAGSRNVVELHGSYWSASCTSCDNYAIEGRSYAWWVKAMHDSPRSPVLVCPRCGGVVKPDVVFFGERVRDYDKACALVEQCDLLLVLGSSLAVYPAALLPQMTEAPIIVVNKGEVRLPHGPNRLFIESDLDTFFSPVAACLGLDVNP